MAAVINPPSNRFVMLTHIMSPPTRPRQISAVGLLGTSFTCNFVGLVLFLGILTMPVMAQVRVWQGTLLLPAYEEGLPDPNPPFDQLATTRFNYPYTLRTNLTDRRADHQWRAIFLENEYLKCSVLPD